jgi:hypothetical protein
LKEVEKDVNNDTKDASKDKSDLEGGELEL